MRRVRMMRVLALACGVAFLAAMAPSSPGRTAVHPHRKLPLWVFTQRAREFLRSKGGAVALAAVERRIREESCAGGPMPEAGAVARRLLAWADRGQIDLVAHVLRHLADGASEPGARQHGVLRCEGCFALAHDAIHGDPDVVARTPRGKNGILPMTAHEFLRAGRTGAPAATPRPAAAAPADVLSRVLTLDHAVSRGLGFERLDLDGDGSLETERLDFDDDGRFEVVHTDADRDGAFEMEFAREPSGRWKIGARRFPSSLILRTAAPAESLKSGREPR